MELYKHMGGGRLARVAQNDFVEEGTLELLPDSVVLGGKRLEELLMKHLYIASTGKRIRLGHARIRIEWLEDGYREVFEAG
jgi:hypothetical protein